MPTKKTTLKQVRSLIGEGKINTAFGLLDGLEMDVEDRDYLATLRHNYSAAQAAFFQESVSQEEYARSNARAANGILQLTQRLEKGSEGLADRQKGLSTFQKTGLGLAAVLLLFMLGNFFFPRPAEKTAPGSQIENTTQGSQSPIIIGDSVQIQYNNHQKEQKRNPEKSD
ncbi:MAG: hypothetical protein KDD02_23230 [Phaeodactylibacter sp.]|nr:hypothetical protein [Phaeodactylibacter sp.]MCB9302492.1 hypothetical protein [Lewinellaceae bacterium]